MPTTAEAGFPGIAGDNWQGVMVPAGTPREVIDLLHREIAEIVTMPEMQDRFTAYGQIPIGSTPEEFAAYIKSEIARWAEVIREAHIRRE